MRLISDIKILQHKALYIITIVQKEHEHTHTHTPCYIPCPLAYMFITNSLCPLAFLHVHKYTSAKVSWRDASPTFGWNKFLFAERFTRPVFTSKIKVVAWLTNLALLKKKVKPVQTMSKWLFLPFSAIIKEQWCIKAHLWRGQRVLKDTSWPREALIRVTCTAEGAGRDQVGLYPRDILVTVHGSSCHPERSSDFPPTEPGAGGAWGSIIQGPVLPTPQSPEGQSDVQQNRVIWWGTLGEEERLQLELQQREVSFRQELLEVWQGQTGAAWPLPAVGGKREEVGSDSESWRRPSKIKKWPVSGLFHKLSDV